MIEFVVCTLQHQQKCINSLTRCTRGDARIVFSVLTKRISMHKKEFLMNIFKYCLKNYIKLHKFANCNSVNYDV